MTPQPAARIPTARRLIMCDRTSEPLLYRGISVSCVWPLLHTLRLKVNRIPPYIIRRVAYVQEQIQARGPVWSGTSTRPARTSCFKVLTGGVDGDDGDVAIGRVTGSVTGRCSQGCGERRTQPVRREKCDHALYDRSAVLLAPRRAVYLHLPELPLPPGPRKPVSAAAP